MRFKKHKRFRRAVKFYVACFGFRQPFKVLCDGTFVHHLVANGLKDNAVANILGGPVKLFTTRCVIAELKSLGDSHADLLPFAHKLLTASIGCDHEKMLHADTCIVEVIGENNPEHFFVATQDADLRKKLQEVPAVPLIFGLRNALFLEPPSASQRQFARKSEEARMHVTELESRLLERSTNKILTKQHLEDSSDENEGERVQNLHMEVERKKRSTRNGAVLKDRPQFKRKKAKGPNPLSIKKKKKRDTANPLSEKFGKTGDDAVKRSRKRKRSRKAKNPAETDR